MKLNTIFKFAGSIIICELAGIIGLIFTFPALQSGWYASLVKPEFAPPNWVFGPIWTILYALMGIAIFLAWQKGWNLGSVKIALVIFMSQLVLNIFWSVIFFGFRFPGGAFIEIIFLILTILATIIAFIQISKPAAWLLVPYILWVGFAGYLNFAIWMLN